MESEVVNLFERAYNHPNFLHATLMTKEILGGCCILFVCRQCNWPVAMGTVSYLLGIDSPSMGPVYQELTKSLNIKTSTQSITDLLESFCYEYVWFCLHALALLTRSCVFLNQYDFHLWNRPSDRDPQSPLMNFQRPLRNVLILISAGSSCALNRWMRCYLKPPSSWWTEHLHWLK